MKFAVDPWDPAYGTANELDPGDASKAEVDLDVEVAAASWAPRPCDAGRVADRILFVDGVRRVEAHVWMDAGDGTPHYGLCASYGAGAVLCDGAATCGPIIVGRGVFTTYEAVEPIPTSAGLFDAHVARSSTPEGLASALQNQMALAELDAAEATCQTGPVDLVVIDGSLRGRQHLSGAVGYVKTHHVTYLPQELNAVVAALAPGQRTPLFTLGTDWSRTTWYARLPGATGSPWAGVVRAECSVTLDTDDAAALADSVTATLPRFASAPHKDSRAPQNLYPIAGLERQLRHRLGDPQVLYRALRLAAAG